MISEQALKDRLQIIAKERAIPFNACWKQLVLERFLARLGRSNYSKKLIFKGGFLLAYMMKIGRETVDLDFLLTRMTAEKKELQKVCEEIGAISCNDGFSFSFAKIELLSQPHMNYPGYRTTLNAEFAKMKDKIHVDIGVGDTVTPETFQIPLIRYRDKPFFEESISLLVYPPETIFAEKLETVLSKGARNSRMKDYHDLFLLSQSSLIDLAKLNKAIRDTFANRDTVFAHIRFDTTELKALQQLWAAHIRNLGHEAKGLGLPHGIDTTIDVINQYINTLF